MKKTVWLWLGASICFAASAGASPWGKLDAALNELARRSETTVDRLRVDPAASALENDRFGTLRLEKYLMAEPSRAPATIQSLGVGQPVPGVAPRLEVFSRLSWDRPLEHRPLDIEKIESSGDKPSNPVEAAMKRLYDGTGKRFQGKERSRVIEDSNKFPPELRVQVAALIDAVADASRMRDSIVKSSELKQGGPFEGKSKRTANLLRDFLNRWWEADLFIDPKMSRLTHALETFDLNALYAGAIPLAQSLDNSANALANINAVGAVHADWHTPLGRIAVGGKGNDTYTGAYALIVDLGGNDVYRGPGAASGQDGVSLLLDLGGDDRYAASDSAMAGPGGAVLGYAGIVDMGSGKDTYEATSWAGGFGFLGVGWIDDRGGDDIYRMQLLSQGSAVFGIGLLLDEQGQDQFTLAGIDSAFGMGLSQGFGGPLGVGALIDLQGNDAYAKADSMWGGPQDFVQGAAWGGEGRQWSGGFGLLMDAAGDDRYRARVNAQGAGSGSGLGILADYYGKDEYRCEHSCQGFGRGLGIGILYDGADDDRYRAAEAAMGYGVDLGTGMLLEGSGDDAYRIDNEATGDTGPSVASSESQGAGWLLDLEGNDTYPELRNQVSSGTSVPWRAPVPGIGVLIDFGQPDSQESYAPCGGEGPALGGMLILPAPNADANPSPSSP